LTGGEKVAAPLSLSSDSSSSDLQPATFESTHGQHNPG